MAAGLLVLRLMALDMAGIQRNNGCAMVKCLLCDKECKDKRGLSGHMQLAHPGATRVDGQEIAERLETLDNSVVALADLLVDTLARMFAHEEVYHGVSSERLPFPSEIVADRFREIREALADLAAEHSGPTGETSCKRYLILSPDPGQGFKSIRYGSPEWEHVRGGYGYARATEDEAEAREARSHEDWKVIELSPAVEE